MGCVEVEERRDMWRGTGEGCVDSAGGGVGHEEIIVLPFSTHKLYTSTVKLLIEKGTCSTNQPHSSSQLSVASQTGHCTLCVQCASHTT